MKFLILILFFAISSLYSIDRTAYFTSGKKFEAKHFVLPSEDKDSLRVFVFFRISNEAQNFKNVGSSESELFESNLELELIAKDNSGIIRNRTPIEATQKVSSYEKTISKTLFYKGFIELKVFNRKHNFELKFFSTSNYEPISIEFTQLKLEIDKNIYSNPLFTYRYENNKYNDLGIFINESGFTFGPYSAKVFIPARDFENETLSFEVNMIESKEDDEDNYFQWSKNVNFTGEVKVISYRDFKFEKGKKDVLFSIDRGKSKDQFLEIYFPEDRIVPGSYSLKIYSDNQEIMKHIFKVEWQNKPVSLNNPDFAADKMYYILNDKEYEEITSGSKNDKFKKILNYWESKDPTPNTPYNESMAQYFSRVDFAYFNFATLAQKDGAETDRGKIFILKGLPDRIINTTEEAERFEIWTYNKLGEEYKFKLVSSGVFLLVEINEL